jgi:hypothetical protein
LKPVDLQYKYKKLIGFTKQQHESLATLEKYGVNVNQFIRQAIKEKIKREWPTIKARKTTEKTPF